MNVNNFSEFYNILTSSGLGTVPPFDNFKLTVDKYLAECDCINPVEKAKKLADSKSLYESIVRGPISPYINTIKSKKSTTVLNFYNNGRLLITY